MQPGQLFKIINTHGTQVVDTWAFTILRNASIKYSSFQFRYLSMCHTRSALSRLTLHTNDTLLDNAREPMLTLVEDTSGGVHDLLFAACDSHRYDQLGVKGFHDSCANNLGTQLGGALKSFGENPNRLLSGAIASASLITDTWTPDPLNLFMNIPVEVVEDGHGGKTRLAAPNCPKGGYVVLKSKVECIVVMSACPMDLTSIYETKGAEFEIFEDRYGRVDSLQPKLVVGQLSSSS